MNTYRLYKSPLDSDSSGLRGLRVPGNMLPVSISKSLFGKDTQVSARLGGIAVAGGFTSFGGGFILSSIGSPWHYGWLASGLVCCGLIFAATHTYKNSGLLVSWLLLFWPTAGVFAYEVFATGTNAPPGKTSLLSQIVLAGIYAGGLAAFVGGSVIFGLVTGIKWTQRRYQAG